MAHLPFFSYDGFGKDMEGVFHYSQAVKRGNVIDLSGQGGWDSKTHAINSDINVQMDQTFKNIQLALVTAGGKGWEEVYQVRAYFLDLRDENAVKALVDNLRKWLPNHKPLLTVLGVSALALEGMKWEIEVSAQTKAE